MLFLLNLTKCVILAKLAEIILAPPGAQLSVEELFSQLKFLLNDQRESMDCVTVDNVLISMQFPVPGG